MTNEISSLLDEFNQLRGFDPQAEFARALDNEFTDLNQSNLIDTLSQPDTALAAREQQLRNSLAPVNEGVVTALQQSGSATPGIEDALAGFFAVDVARNQQKEAELAAIEAQRARRLETLRIASQNTQAASRFALDLTQSRQQQQRDRLAAATSVEQLERRDRELDQAATRISIDQQNANSNQRLRQQQTIELEEKIANDRASRAALPEFLNSLNTTYSGELTEIQSNLSQATANAEKNGQEQDRQSAIARARDNASLRLQQLLQRIVSDGSVPSVSGLDPEGLGNVFAIINTRLTGINPTRVTASVSRPSAGRSNNVRTANLTTRAPGSN